MPRKIRVRSLLMGAVFTLLFIVLMSRLYWLQVVDAAWLSERAEQMWDTERKLPAQRGTIYDRNGQVLAGDAKGYTVILNPRVIHEFGLAREVSQGLSTILNKAEHEIFDQATSKDDKGQYRIYRQVRNEGWKIDEETAERIRAWKQELVEKHGIKGSNWQGVTLEEEQLRYYPKNSLASHVLGFVDKDGVAKSGLELGMDDVLRGTPGSVQYQKDRLGQKLPGAKPELVPPVDGQSLVLTIDQTIQHYTETALKKIYDQYKPKSMTAIAVDPNTMEVLAMASAPDFNPNRYWEYDTTRDFKNMAVQSRYEPGSTFKLVTLAGAVEEGIFDPNAKYLSGSIRVPGRTINDHRRGGWGEITYLEGLLRSSNVAFVKLGKELGEDRLESYIERFGFTRKTGIDLPGEVSGMMRLRYPADYAAATYGQGGILATPMQQLAAYAAIANGGKLMQPYVVKQVVDSATGAVVSENKPKVVSQVVDERIAKEITEYLEQVVTGEHGTGRRARIDGYAVAGKTGTANIVIDGGYSENTWVVSFIGFAPADNPRIAVAVIADQPNLGGDSNRAGEATAPVFKEIVSQTLRYWGVKPDTELPAALASSGASAEAAQIVPDLSGLPAKTAVEELKAHGFTAARVGDGKTVLGQYPAAGERLSGAAQVYLLTVPQEQAPIPNLVGESLRDAVQLCALLGLKCEAVGEGYVVSQNVVEADGEKLLRVHLQPLRETGAPIRPDPSEDDGFDDEASGEDEEENASDEDDASGDGAPSGTGQGAPS